MMPIRGRFVRVSDSQDRFFGERVPGNLESDRKAISCEAARYANCWQPGEIERTAVPDVAV